jgi:hypothetical protein
MQSTTVPVHWTELTAVWNDMGSTENLCQNWIVSGHEWASEQMTGANPQSTFGNYLHLYICIRKRHSITKHTNCTSQEMQNGWNKSYFNNNVMQINLLPGISGLILDGHNLSSNSVTRLGIRWSESLQFISAFRSSTGHQHCRCSP